MNDSKRKPKKALEVALNLLSLKDRTTFEIRTRLKEKEFNEADIEQAVEKLQGWGFLDDEKFAQNYIRQAKQLKPKGKYRLRAELIRKGIEKDIVESALAEKMPPDEEPVLIEQVLQRYLPRTKGLAKEKIYQRAIGFLMRRGFSYGESQKAVRLYLEKK